MGYDAPPGQYTYVRGSLSSWWAHLPLLLLAGLIFALLWAPVFVALWFDSPVPALLASTITVVPAWVALLAQVADVVHDRKTSIVVMLRELPRYWARSALLGLLTLVPGFGALLTLPALSQTPIPISAVLGLGASALVALVLANLFLYALPLLVLHDQRPRIALRNAFVLSGRHTMNTIGLLAMLVLFALGTIYLSPMLLLIWPAFYAVFVVNNCRMVLAEELGEHDVTDA